MIRYSEDNAAARIRAHHAPDLRAVAAILGALAADGPYRVSDLSLGGWRPHQLAAEWSGTPDLCDPPATGAPTRIPATIDFAQIAAAGIEAEALGIRVVRDAYAHAQALLADVAGGGRATFILVVPHRPHGWREEDLLLLHYLAAAPDPTSYRIVLLATAPTLADNVPPDGLPIAWHPADARGEDVTSEVPLGALPGLLPFGFAAPGIRLDDGRLLLAPELRSRRLIPTDFDRLKVQLEATRWLAAYAELRGSNFHIDPGSMSAHAARAFAAGATELAIDYLRRGIECARGSWRQGLLCQLQGYRIATHRFVEASAEPLPPGGTGQIGAFLEMSRGWGYALQGDGETALPFFSRAAGLLAASTPDPHFLCYLRNITALALARCGRTDEALVLERLIEAENQPPQRSWAMHYVNQINLARLLMPRDIAAAGRHYAEAFATQDGARSPVDRIYANGIQARLAERMAQDARPAWLRAALHFAAWPVPEALGSRHAAAFMPGGGADLSPHARTEAVAAALCARLGYDPVDEEGAPPDGVAIVSGDEAIADGDAVAILAGAGWSAIALRSRPAPLAGGPARCHLNRCLAQELLGSARPPADLGVLSLAIDHGLGSDMAMDRAGYAALALRVGVSRLIEGGESLAIAGADERSLLLESRLALNPQVERIARHAQTAVLRFKRYRGEATAHDPLGLLERAQDRPRVADLLALADEAALLADLRRLEREGVLRLACAQDAGMAWTAIA